MGYIYKITNLINGKMYIGQTSRSVETRWKEHLRNKDECPIHVAMQKYGIENFNIETLEECENDLLDAKEVEYIQKYQSYNGHIGYNATKGGNSNTQHIINWIKTHPEEVKENLDKARQIAIQKFKDNPELQEKREKARQEGYQRYIQENREEWMQAQQKKLEKAREVLKQEYEKDPSKIIKRAQENGKKASKAVYQIDKDTNQKIQKFESCSAAARFLNKDGGHTNISKACRKGGTAYGYKWAYVE